VKRKILNRNKNLSGNFLPEIIRPLDSGVFPDVLTLPGTAGRGFFCFPTGNSGTCPVSVSNKYRAKRKGVFYK
jgi:hypothetical protein